MLEKHTSSAPAIAQDLAGGILAAADAPARMGGRAALVAPLDRRPIIHPMRRRAHAPPGFGGGGPGACCRLLASIGLLVRVVLIVLVRPICLLLLRCVMAHGAAGRCAEKRMMASDVPHDGPSGRPCQTSRLCTRRDAQTDANRGNDQEFSHGSSPFQSCSGSCTE
jgi:hypothetical protein